MARPPGDKRPSRKTKNGGITLLIPETREKFLANLRTGVPIPVAAKAAGVAGQTVNLWLVNGRRAAAKRESGETLTEHEQACLDLTIEAEKVYEEVHLLLAGRVVQASTKDWRAATWILQRRHPDHWNRVDQLEVTGRGGGPIEIEQVLARAQEYLDVEEPAPNGQKSLPA
jgi:hypothetical protein